ncbi:MAG: immunoglobulin-like domain-containing protein [Bacilli bacterium]
MVKKITKLFASIMLVLTLFSGGITSTNATEIKKDESNSEQKSVSNDGAVTINIPEYDESVGWKFGSVYNLEVIADFGDDITSAGKELVITLPDGMTFHSIPVVKNKYDISGVDKAILNELGASDPMTTAVDSISLPKYEKHTNSTFGEVKYTFQSGVKMIAINLNVSVDNKKNANAGTISNPIIAKVNMAGNEIGSASQEIKTSYAWFRKPLFYKINEGTSVIMPSTGEKEYVADAPMNGFIHKERDYDVFVKKATCYFYYPEGAEFVSGKGVDDPENNRIISTSNNPYEGCIDGFTTIDFPSLKFKFPEGTPPGEYTSAAKDYAEYEYYDGTTGTVTSPYEPYKIEVVNKVENSVVFNHYVTGGYDSSIEDDSYYSNGIYTNLTNDKPIPVTNQILEYEFDENMEVGRIVFPTDRKILEAEYTTNKNSTPVDFADKIAGNGAYMQVNTSSLNLADGEILTSIKVHLSDIVSGFTIVDSLNRASVHFRILNGVSNASMTSSIYDKNDKENTIQTSNVTVKDVASSKETSSNSSVKITNNATVVSSIIAGDSLDFEGTIKLHRNFYGNTLAMNAPEIYLREMEGFTLGIDDLKLKDQNGNDVEYEVKEHTGTDGSKIYKIITTKDTSIGFWFNGREKYLKISLPISTDIKLTGSYNNRDFIAFGAKGFNFAHDSINQKSLVDYIDFDGDKNTNERINSVMSSGFVVLENKNVLVETFLALEGEEPKGSYVEGNDETVAYFTPGTDASYSVNITNNGDSAASKFSAYVPIPDTGDSFGKAFQSEPFKWDLTLTDGLSDVDGFEIYYGVGLNESTFQGTSNYYTLLDLMLAGHTLEDVNMVKIVGTEPFAPGASVKIKVPLVVDETFETATSGDKIGKRNVYNPVYEVESETFAGVLNGTKVGTELVIAEIGGLVFIDKDGDGLYNSALGDNVVADHEVELYGLNETSGKYEPVLDSEGKQYKVKTDKNGVYLFDYTTGLGYGKYGVRFVETGGEYQYTANVNKVGSESINSDAIVANDIPNAGDKYRGWVLGIDATREEAKTIGVGFLKYNPPVDLKVNLTDDVVSVKAGESIVVKPTIEPDFFETIKATDGYKWELVNASDSTYVSLSNATSKNVIVVGQTMTAKDKIVEVKLTIKDIYGTEKSDIVKVKVTPNTPAAVSGEEIVTYVEDATSIDYKDGVSAKDAYGDDITLTVSNMKIDTSKVDTKEAGTYEAVYSITDAYGNIAKYSRKVKINGDVKLVSANQKYELENNDVLSLVKTNATASYLKASDTVGSSAEKVNLDVETNVKSSNTGVLDLTKAGAYKVEYSATNSDGKSASNEVVVNVIDNYTSQSVNYALRARSYSIKLSEVDKFTKSEAKSLGEVLAWDMQTGDDLTTEVEQTSYDKISSATESGVYKLTYKVINGTEALEKEVVVHVLGEDDVVSSDKTVVLYAKDYVMNLKDASGYTSSKAIVASKTKAVEFESGKDLGSDKLSADVSKIVSAESVGSVDTKVNYEGKVETTVNTSIIDESYVVGTKDVIGARNIVVSKSDLASISDSEIIKRSGVKAWRINDGSDVTYSVDKSKVGSEVGNYEIEFKTENGTKKQITVIVLDNPVCNISCESVGVSEVLSAVNVAVELSDLVNYDYESGAKLKAYNVNNVEEMNVNYDASAVENKAGSYDLVSSSRTIVTTTRVTTGDNLVVQDGVAIAASNTEFSLFEVLSLKDSDELDKELKEKSKPRVWKIATNEELGEVEIDSSVIEVKDVEAGSYDIVYTYESSLRSSKKIETKSKMNIASVVGEEDAIYARDIALTAEEVESIDKEEVISQANIRAWEIANNSDVEYELDISELKAKQGYYEIKIETELGTKHSIYAYVGKTNRPVMHVIENIVIYANDYSVEAKELKGMSVSDHVKKSEASVITKGTHEPVEMSYVDVEGIKASAGKYNAGFGVKPQISSEDKIYSRVVVTVNEETGELSKTGIETSYIMSGLIIIGLLLIRKTVRK